MSKKIIVKVQTPTMSNAPEGMSLALVYDQTRSFQMQIERSAIGDDAWNAIVARGGKAFYLAKLSGGAIELVRQVSDRGW